METERHTRGDALALEQATAWREYLETTRGRPLAAGYPELEPWAWARLTQRLDAVERERARLGAAAA